MWNRIAISVALWSAICMAGLPDIACGQVVPYCEDVNGDGDRWSVNNFNTLADYLRGKDVYVTPESQFLDCYQGWTIADLNILVDASYWVCRQFACCQDFGSREYGYGTVGDTIFFPQARNVPDTVSQIELPVYLKYDSDEHGRYCPFSTIIPMEYHSSTRFALDSSHYQWASDTAIIVLPWDWWMYPTPNPFKLTSMKFVRTDPGLGQVIPKVLDSVSDRRLGIASVRCDIYTPTVVTYDASVCCWGATGNVDCDTSQTVDIGDVTELIRLLFITLHDPCCVDAANVDSDPGLVIDIGDLTKLIAHLFISQTELLDCNWARLPR